MRERQREERTKRWGEDVAAAAAVTVSRLLLAWRAGGSTGRGRKRDRDVEEGLFLCLWGSGSEGAISQQVDFITGHRSAHPWIISSE